jgi:hypothetical protein
MVRQVQAHLQFTSLATQRLGNTRAGLHCDARRMIRFAPAASTGQADGITFAAGTVHIRATREDD